MSGIGVTGFVLIILVALLLFGPSKLPELGRAVGRTLREFKEGAKEILPDDEPERKEVQRADTPSLKAVNREETGKEKEKRLPD